MGQEVFYFLSILLCLFTEQHLCLHLVLDLLMKCKLEILHLVKLLENLQLIRLRLFVLLDLQLWDNRTLHLPSGSMERLITISYGLIILSLVANRNQMLLNLTVRSTVNDCISVLITYYFNSKINCLSREAGILLLTFILMEKFIVALFIYSMYMISLATIML